MTVTPETLLQWADKIDARLGPIGGADADTLAVLLRQAGAKLAGIPHPTSSEQFAKALADLGMRAPWKAYPDRIYSLDGRTVAIIDPNLFIDGTNERHALAAWIILAVNTLAGFKAVVPK